MSSSSTPVVFISPFLLSPTSVHRFNVSQRIAKDSSGFRVSCKASTPSSSPSLTLKTQLRDAIRPLNRGFSIGADDPPTLEEEAVEDIVETLEDLCGGTVETEDLKTRLSGSWALIYTSSGTSRYSGGLSGLASSLPRGKSERIWCSINVGECEAEFFEDIVWRFGKLGVKVKGDMQISDGGKVFWSPGRVSIGKWSLGVNAWRSIRAFAYLTHSYLDEELDIARGPTGALMIFERIKK